MTSETISAVALVLAGGGVLLAIQANMRLNRALKPKPVTLPELANAAPPKAEVEPFTLEDVAKLLELRADWQTERARKAEALERAGAAHQYDQKASEQWREGSMFRYAAHLVRQKMEAEATVS